MIREFKFDNATCINNDKTNVTILFFIVKDSYALVVRLCKYSNGDKSVLVTIRNCFDKLCLYNDSKKSLLLSKTIAKIKNTILKQADNKNLYQASILLQAYEDLSHEHISTDLIDKWYNISTLLLNNIKFKLSLDNETYECL